MAVSCCAGYPTRCGNLSNLQVGCLRSNALCRWCRGSEKVGEGRKHELAAWSRLCMRARSAQNLGTCQGLDGTQPSRIPVCAHLQGCVCSAHPCPLGAAKQEKAEIKRSMDGVGAGRGEIWSRVLWHVRLSCLPSQSQGRQRLRLRINVRSEKIS